jgi:hypothetical protein
MFWDFFWDFVPTLGQNFCPKVRLQKAKECNFLSVGCVAAVVIGVECACVGASNGGVKSCV